MFQKEQYMTREQFSQEIRQDLAHDFDMMVAGKRFMEKHNMDREEIVNI
jgi:hypothetical protein